ncbi:hypothetical protein PSE_3885 [Pseudovibrio sp. FO-BEG1]|nr:hypothetical protein PSE_3885 [Pseudovibrio sp. FO-BEG1]
MVLWFRSALRGCFVRGLGARAYVYQKLRPVEEQK